MQKGILFCEKQDKWHIISEKGIFPLHPRDLEDPMLCLKHNDLVNYKYQDICPDIYKPFAKIINFI